MKFVRLLIIVLALGISTVYGQDWEKHNSEDSSYNCEVVRSLVKAFGEQLYVRIDETEFTVEEYYAFTIPGCLDASEVSIAVNVAEAVVQTGKTMVSVETSGSPPQITVDTVINLRACASTSCARVGRALPGDVFNVLGKDGDWYEIAFEDDSAYIAAWLTRIMMDPPTGLLVDFQFGALNPNAYHEDFMHGSTFRRGTHWLNLTRPDGSPAAFELQAMNWTIDGDAQPLSQPRFFGWGEQNWSALPDLLPGSSFYIYVLGDQDLYEFPISSYSYKDSFNLGFDDIERPGSVVAGAQVRLLVVDSGQSDHIQRWIEAGYQPEAVAPPAQPEPPSLRAGDGEATISFGSQPNRSGVSSYEAMINEAGDTKTIWIANINPDKAYTIEHLNNGSKYEVALVAIGAGGRSRQSRRAIVDLGD